MASLFAPTANVLCVLMFIVGCALAIYGVIQAVALLDKPAGWYCHLRGVSLITMFLLSAVGLCEGVFERHAPGLGGSVSALATGVLYAMFARQLRASAIRRKARRAAESVAARVAS